MSPKHIRVTAGFHGCVDDGGIRLNLMDLAIMQIIDCRSSTALDDIICGMNRKFFAPEVQDANVRVTHLADVWSLGAILYVLIANRVIHEERITKQDSDVFDF